MIHIFGLFRNENIKIIVKYTENLVIYEESNTNDSGCLSDYHRYRCID
jgi:hypothetical protein